MTGKQHGSIWRPRARGDAAIAAAREGGNR